MIRMSNLLIFYIQNDTNVEFQNKEKSRSKSDVIQTKGQGQV